MRVSQFEIYRICQRALEGLGAPYGIDRDGAQAAVWLEARGLPGLALLAGDLAHLAIPDAFAGLTPPISATGNAALLEAGGRPAVAFLGGAVDYAMLLALRSPEGRGQLAIQDCRSPLFLLPAAVAAASEGARLHLAWSGALLGIDPGRLSIHLAPGRDVISILGETGPFAVRLEYAPAGTAFEPAAGLQRVLGENDLAIAFDRALDQGVAVDDGIWQRLSMVAARVQVPASEVSRRKGAGGGDANA
jgi:hypothetical protein